MNKLGDVIKGKINALLKQAQVLTNQYNGQQKVITDAILVEETRLKLMEAYLDQDLDAVKKEFSSIFDIYSADAPKEYAAPNTPFSDHEQDVGEPIKR